jgi:Acyl-CoA carboxylase epsilon subunit
VSTDGSSAGSEPAKPDQPTEVALRVVHGNPTPEELAALIAVVATRAGGDDPAPTARSLWGMPVLRGAHHPAPGAWRASALPR